MPYQPSEHPLDLIECGRKFKRRVAVEQFAQPIVLLADAVVARGQSTEELNGIRKCMAHLIRNLEWNEGYRLLPSMNSVSDLGPSSDHRYLLPDSVIATALAYRKSLNEPATGLRAILLQEFVQGLEWACAAIERIGICAVLHEAPMLQIQQGVPPTNQPSQHDAGEA